jgi:hypothetical protein
MVALHLLKWVHFLNDAQARDLDLCYFRDIDGREVDFIVTENSIPIIAIECKLNDASISKHLKYFKERMPNCESWQLSLSGTKDYISKEGIRVCPAIKFLQTLV